MSRARLARSLKWNLIFNDAEEQLRQAAGDRVKLGL